MTRRQAVASLILVCLIWGASFTVIKETLALISPLLLMGLKFGLAALLLIGSFRALSRQELVGGMILGLLFWGGMAFQTFGLEGTTPSRSAFITSLATPLVPVVFFLVYRRAPHLLTIAGVILAGVGMYLLALPDARGGGLNRGDLLTLGCAVMFSAHIVAAGHYSRRGEPSRLLAVELATAGAVSLLLAPVLETPRVTPTLWFAAALTFLTLTGLWTFYVQLRAQQVLSPSHAALIFMLEPVFAALTSFVVLGERLELLQWGGAALILTAMALPALEPPHSLGSG